MKGLIITSDLLKYDKIYGPHKINKAISFKFGGEILKRNIEIFSNFFSSYIRQVIKFNLINILNMNISKNTKLPLTDGRIWSLHGHFSIN